MKTFIWAALFYKVTTS